jgi:hypothetical protein
MDLADYYKKQWELFPEGTTYLDCLFESLNSNFVKQGREKGLDVDTVANV